jgi:cell wall-associated NlpC family hydrolase
MGCSFNKTVIFLGVFVLALPLEACENNQSESQASDSPEAAIKDTAYFRTSPATKAQRIVNYAATLLGTPYKVAGKDEKGFDCSGFVAYVFKNQAINLPSSTKALIELGREINLSEAAPGDLIFFTGTDPNSTEVGHAGIIVSHTSDSTTFIHSSSARSSACVKYNVLEASPGYQRRFLMVKRVL